jgi:serine/threonine-protein phosphatase 2A regulatory subunit A
LTVEDLIVIAQQLTPAEVKEQLLKQVRHSIADKSWRVRYMAANHFNEVSLPLATILCRSLIVLLQLAEAVGAELVREELIGQYVQLLKDNEAEVRTAGAGQIPGVLQLCLAQAIFAHRPTQGFLSFSIKK